MNLPNALSLFRIVLAAAFTVLLSLASENMIGSWQVKAAFTCFLVAAITDFFDGYLARKFNLVTDLGKLLDPLADKILVAAAFVLFTEHRLCPGWVTVAILFREFAVTGLRLLLVEKGVVLPADQLGKWKTVTQMAFCVITLFGLSFNAEFTLLFSLSKILMYAALILTLFSGANYLIKGGKNLV